MPRWRISQLNRALHSIARTRTDRDPDTQPYVQRRTGEGLSKRRIRRCLKRYIAHQIFRTLAASTTHGRTSRSHPPRHDT